MQRQRRLHTDFWDRLPRSEVHVAGGLSSYENTRQALLGIDLACASGKRVLLKPNAGRVAPPGHGITTDARVVAAAIDAFREAGAEVAVGESPIMGVDTLEALTAAGIRQVAEERDCRLIDMDARPCVDVSVPDGLAIQALKVCADILDHDLIVSLPVMKTHMHTGVSLSIKNMKGGLWRRSKVELHMLPPVEGREEKPIDIAIADMASVLTPHLAIIDGTVGMEGLGPSAGAPKSLGVVVVSTDACAADAVACELMGLHAKAIPHLAESAARGVGVIDLDCIDVAPVNWRSWRRAFARPPSDLTIEFPRVTVLDENSCSACQSTLLLFLKRYGDQVFDYFPPESEACFAIGKGHDQVPAGTVCVGNCTARHRLRGVFVPGCPPVTSQILTALSHEPEVDTEDGGSGGADAES